MFTTAPQTDTQSPETNDFGRRLQSLRMQRGWNREHLAAEAGLSRTTLFHLEEGRTARPRMATINKLARALKVPVRRLFPLDPEFLVTPEYVVDRDTPTDDWGRGELDDDFEARRKLFDRVTNPVIQEVFTADPTPFQGWAAEDWEELYSTVGMGGALRAEGVRNSAEWINRKKLASEQLRIVLETHLADVSVMLIETIYRMIQVGPGLRQEGWKPPSRERPPGSDR